ncbi:MAG: class I poly(R)-hydroxyalkanoic acid synthase [Arenicellales bacterium]
MSENQNNTDPTPEQTDPSEILASNIKQLESLLREISNGNNHFNHDPYNLSEACSAWFEVISKNPEKVFEAGLQYWQDAMKLYHQSALALMGGETAEPVITEQKGDRRFRHEAWQDQPVYNLIKQSYLLTSRWARNLVTDVDGLDKQTAEKVAFFTERYLDSLSPTNFATTNPAVIEKTIESNGENLVKGLQNMLGDLKKGNGSLQISMTDTEAFELGKNVATTPGKVVFRNRMLELLQYTPTSKSVYTKPLLIIPPWINKYYVMDLQPKNSLIKWLVDQGHTVFVVSWINPDESYRDTGFEDYVIDGVGAALSAIEKATGQKKINAIGYCIGGALLATALAYYKATGDDRITSATLLTTMLDYSDPGELGVFVDQKQVDSLDLQMQDNGYLEGSSMATTFNMLRANDLIWSFYINNYLLGNDPRPFDLLYWNSDSTRMPAKMHSWYLQNFYVDNLLCQPGGISIDGVEIDLSTVDVPICFVSTIEDHIAPWKSTYAGAKLFSGPVQFILGGSGHIAGVVNPPSEKKYGYRVTNKPPANPEKWFTSAEQNEGSWWPEWQRWISRKAGKKVPARKPGDGKLKVIEDAPGSYVKVRLGTDH